MNDLKRPGEQLIKHDDEKKAKMTTLTETTKEFDTLEELLKAEFRKGLNVTRGGVELDEKTVRLEQIKGRLSMAQKEV